MDRVNPIYIPRNHLVEEVLTAATAGDLAPLEQLLDAVRSPFDERAGLRALRRAGREGVQRLVPNILWNLTARAYRDGDHMQREPQESP